MNRRGMLASSLALAAGGLAGPAAAAPHGSLDAGDFGVVPDARADQSRAFRALLEAAAARDLPVFLPPGDYVVSGIRLPRRIRIAGVAGATRIVYGGGGFLLAADDAGLVHLEGLTLEGGGRPLGDGARALVEMRGVDDLVVDRCTVSGSAASGVVLERASGRLERSTVTGAAAYAVYSVQAGQMRIADNVVTDCADGGILVHRREVGHDGTIVTGNRIERIGAGSGGTGQYGNGINVFRAGGVIVANNHVADCAFSAIRANSAGNIQIVANQCLRSGETAIYSEFAFEGAVINSNIVDGAAIGISVANFNEGGRMAVCSGNIVRNLVDRAPYEAFEAMGFGIGISVEADTAVTGNLIEGAPRCGMLLGWGPFLRNVVATGNIVRDTPEGFAVSVVDGAGSVLIADNVVDGAQRAVAGYRWRERVTGDLAAGEEAGFPHLRIGRAMPG